MRRALEGTPGVRDVRVNLDSGWAEAEVDEDVDQHRLVEAVRGKVIFAWARDVLARLKWWDR